ncbi:hypothetical protein CANMA_001283 [Candida margitis]|uniref:uncharacterized protein n=1 Tax=Candida margitis TaxID=1775924 RepID=UPI002226407C|nr:uncharacterized protein CANMA_001283 [Candida margitis]KAI5969620.1 hypothetical protein CANMA_001283 [Candida margitis]
MKFTTITAVASIAAVATAAPTASSDAISVPRASSAPLFQEISQLEKDISSIVQDVQAVVPLITGNSTFPENIKDLITSISQSAGDISRLVGDVSSDLNGIFGQNN